mmetsp:Transcript_83466/g.260643  ORF Transcript_83466/g.260643 Transcript_83466/m.260643 type:complete len:337 (+) Transcript_83466:106-1116(+)
MTFFLRFLCAVGFAASLASGQEASAEADVSALVQREVQLLQSSGHFAFQREGSRLSPQMMRTFVRSIISQLQKQLQDTEVELEHQRAAAVAVNQYVRKVRSTLGRRGTLFGEVAGLMPAGELDDIDRTVAVALLGLLREKNFTDALVTNLKGLANEITTYRWRAAKRVTDLVVESANATDSKLPSLLKSFFGNQHHLLSSFSKSLEKGMRMSLALLPSNYSFTGSIARSLVDELVDHMNGVLDNNTEISVRSNGGKFCGGIDIMLMEDLLPLANATVMSLHGADAFATANMPEVVPQVTEVLKALSSISSGLTKVRAEAGSWIEHVCGLVGAVAVM